MDQTEKNSVRAYIFRVAPHSGHTHRCLTAAKASSSLNGGVTPFGSKVKGYPRYDPAFGAKTA